MLRTNDGKLCILDFGLMTEITDDQKYGMVEAIAHLINRDYTEIGQDFKNLDFIPPDTDTTPIVVSRCTVKYENARLIKENAPHNLSQSLSTP